MVNSNLAYKTDAIPEREVVIDESPVKWCSVSLSDVVSRGKRLEASVFDVEVLQSRNRVEKNVYGAMPLAGTETSLCSAYRPGICKRNFVEDSADAVPMLTPSQVIEVKPKAEKWLSKKFVKGIPDWFVKKGELLLTCSGTVGNTTLVSNTLDNCCVSQNMIRLIVKDSKITGYVYAFLKTKTGQIFLTKNNYGAVIKHIDPEHLSTVSVPNAPVELKQKINDLIVRSYELRDESNELIDKATALLKAELHLPDISAFDVELYKKQAPVDTFNVKLSDMSGRLDAFYHVPIVNAITEHLQKYAEEVTTVGDARISKEVILPGRFKRVYVDEGYGRVFIGGKQLYELDPTNKKYLSNVHHGDRIAKQLELHEDMTLITCSGTIGKVALVGKHWENWTANQHIIRVIPATKDIAGYLNIFLASDYGFQLITRFTYGSVVDEIDDNHVRAIPVPILKNHDVQKQINDLALEANQKRYEAYQLEQEALRIMDTEVIYAK